MDVSGIDNNQAVTRRDGKHQWLLRDLEWRFEKDKRIKDIAVRSRSVRANYAPASVVLFLKNKRQSENQMVSNRLLEDCSDTVRITCLAGAGII